MAAESSIVEKCVVFNTSAKVIASAFGADSSDCCFKFPDECTKEVETAPAHSKLLAALSPVFATMFSDNWSVGSKEVTIVGVSFEDFSTFLAYFYAATVRLTKNNVKEIAGLAHKYDVAELSVACETFAIELISVDTVLDYHVMGTLYGQRRLLGKCNESIAKNTEHVLKSKAFMRCNGEMLAAILRLPNKSCAEHVVFDACIEWAENQCHSKNITKRPEDLREQLADCFQLIRFTAMSRDEFMKRYESFKSAFTNDELVQIFEHFVRNAVPATVQAASLFAAPVFGR